MEPIRFWCRTCNEEHEGVPDIGFDVPAYWREGDGGTLTTDTCTLGEHLFVRAVLVPVRATNLRFGWGTWVSLSQKSFAAYEADDGKACGLYFGWVSNRLPGYPDSLKLAADVHFQPDGRRPSLVLRATQHPLVKHQRDRIEPEERWHPSSPSSTRRRARPDPAGHGADPGRSTTSTPRALAPARKASTPAILAFAGRSATPAEC